MSKVEHSYQEGPCREVLGHKTPPGCLRGVLISTGGRSRERPRISTYSAAVVTDDASTDVVHVEAAFQVGPEIPLSCFTISTGSTPERSESR